MSNEQSNRPLEQLSAEQLTGVAGGNSLLRRAAKWAFGSRTAREGAPKILHPGGGTISTAPSRARQAGQLAKTNAGKIGIGAAGAGAGWAAKSGVDAITSD